MSHQSFSVRLQDLLSTLEGAALIGAARMRLRGLGEQLQFACLAMPCDQALVALELERLGRLQVPGVASADGWRTTDLEFLPSGTPFAYLLGGGSGYAAELAPGDPMLEVLAPVLDSAPRHALLVPIRVGASVVGGAALLSADAHMGDRELALGERLASVLALTLEAYRTERVLYQLFARALPDLCGDDALTGFPAALERHLHSLRLTPEYRRRLDLARSVARLAASGTAETRLATDILGRVEAYVGELERGEETDEEAAADAAGGEDEEAVRVG
ncbi:MAG: hypothetical protein IT373_22030 [Polyangiaceae bacterium]|nr:hypothetical protein [Polyangiaceae bacterium]